METSPHTRGKREPAADRVHDAGNIPAYAGKADAHLPEDGSLQKHPRIRGESVSSVDEVCCTGETSPHTRGKLLR